VALGVPVVPPPSLLHSQLEASRGELCRRREESREKAICMDKATHSFSKKKEK